MKKVKLMLLSFCVLAAVAGALAFKAKGNAKLCWAPTVAGPNFCGTTGSELTCPTYTVSAGETNITNQFICTTPSTGVSGHECDIAGAALTCDFASIKSTTTE